jgi:hypothetical protein
MPGLVSLMNRSVTFNDQVDFAAEEVCDVIAQLMLSPKLKAKQSTILK